MFGILDTTLKKDPQEVFFRAVVSGDLDKCKELFQENPEIIHISDSSGMTPLHEAAFCGRLDMVSWLLDCGALIHVQQTSSPHDTPLALALLNGHLDVSQLLIRQHGLVLDSNASHEEECCARVVAASRGRSSGFKTLEWMCTNLDCPNQEDLLSRLFSSAGYRAYSIPGSIEAVDDIVRVTRGVLLEKRRQCDLLESGVTDDAAWDTLRRKIHRRTNSLDVSSAYSNNPGLQAAHKTNERNFSHQVFMDARTDQRSCLFVHDTLLIDDPTARLDLALLIPPRDLLAHDGFMSYLSEHDQSCLVNLKSIVGIWDSTHPVSAVETHNPTTRGLFY